MIRVIFTSDYEIHGSGRGHPRPLMVAPTDRMLADFDAHGARLTVLADVAEIWKFKEYRDITGHDRFAYEAIAEQLRRAVATGHEVGLHLHSSFLGSTFRQGAWQQSYADYDLARLGAPRLRQLLGDAKRFLEELVQPVCPEYACTVFRAANWSMHPSPDIVSALMDCGFRIDTSVFKHGVEDDLVRFDYREAASDVLPWPVSVDDVCQRDPAGRLFEFPIYCELRRLPVFLTANRVYRVVAQRLNPLPEGDQWEAVSDGTVAETPPRGQRLRALARQGAAQFPWKADFNQCTGRQLIAALLRVERRYRHLRVPVPFVLIGHSKTYTRINGRSLRPFLEYVAARPHRFQFSRFADFDVETFRATK